MNSTGYLTACIVAVLAFLLRWLFLD